MLFAGVVGTCSLLASPSADAAHGVTISTGQTDTSISVAWSYPTGEKSQLCFGPELSVCYKEPWTTPTTCINGLTNANHTIQNLDPGTEYKIWGRGKGRFRVLGIWSPCVWRSAAPVFQSTRMSTPPPVSGHLSLDGVSSSSLSATVTVTSPSQLSAVNVCYKKRNLVLPTLKGACETVTPYPAPNSEGRGYHRYTTVTSTLSSTFFALAECQHYKVIAIGFESPGPGTVVLGEGIVKTIASQGACNLISFNKTGHIGDQVGSDHDEIADDYVQATDAWYSGFYHVDLLTQLGYVEDPDLFNQLSAFAIDNEDPRQDGSDLLRYMVEDRPDLYAAWQEDPQLPQSLTIEGYMEENHPDVLQDILFLGGFLEPMPALSPVAYALLALVLAGAAWGLVRRRR